MAINIIKNTNFGTHNTSSGRETPKYIVMHYTASNGGTAANNISYFNNTSTTSASADFFVDEVGIYQYNMQLDSRYSWAVGVDYSGGTAEYWGKCTNKNSISIEMCCYLSGSKWYIKDATYTNAVALAKYLMEKYNISAGNVIRHYDVCKKSCPDAVGWLSTTGSETTWKKFKLEIGSNTTATGTTTSAETSSDVIYRVRKSATDVASQIGAYKNLDSAKVLANKNSGYSVYDSNGNLIYSPTTTTTATSSSYQVKVAEDVLNVRKGAGTSYAVATTVKKNEVYTIVDTKSADGYTWGKLKSGAGWIALEYTTKV